MFTSTTENTQNKGFIEHAKEFIDHTTDRIQNAQKNWQKFTSSTEGKTAAAFVALGSIALIATSFFLPPVGAAILLAALKVILVTLVLLILAMLSTDEDPAGKKTEENYIQLTDDSFAQDMGSVQPTPTALQQVHVEK